MEVARVIVLPQVAVSDEGHGDIMHGCYVKAEILRERARASSVWRGNDRFQEFEALFEG